MQDSLGKWRTRLGHLIQRPIILTVAHPYAATGRRWISVIGIPVTEGEETGAISQFLDAFQQAARRAGAEYLMDSFDSATLLMDAEHRTRFFENLDSPAE